MTPAYCAFIAASRFCILSTIGPEGTDGSPRGDQGPVVSVADDETLLLPDWQGNDRIDSLRNIVRDGRVSLFFMVTGSTISVRVNGTARLSADPAICGRFDRDGKHPRSVMVIRVAEVYSQCSRAIQRSDLWTAAPVWGLPSFGQMLEDATKGEIDGAAYDRDRAGGEFKGDLGKGPDQVFFSRHLACGQPACGCLRRGYLGQDEAAFTPVSGQFQRDDAGLDQQDSQNRQERHGLVEQKTAVMAVPA